MPARSKRSSQKTFRVCFFPVGGQALEIVENWVVYLREVKLWSDRRSPVSRAVRDQRGQPPIRGCRTCTKSLVECDTDLCDLPRGLRLSRACPTSTPTRSGKPLCNWVSSYVPGPEEFKAWSQNLGHDDVMVTYLSYGKVPHLRQAEIFRGLHQPRTAVGETGDLLRTLEKILSSRLVPKVCQHQHLPDLILSVDGA